MSICKKDWLKKSYGLKIYWANKGQIELAIPMEELDIYAESSMKGESIYLPSGVYKICGFFYVKIEQDTATIYLYKLADENNARIYL